MPEYRLSYFDIRGRGEPIRLLFALAGVDYEDRRVKDEDWEKLKPEAPFGQMPFLDTEGTTLCQTNTILRYLGDKFGYSGNTPIERARVQMIAACMEDMLQPWFEAFFTVEESKKAELRKKYFEDKAPGYLTNFEKLLKQNGGGDGYFVGDKISYADVVVYFWIPWIEQCAAMSEEKFKFNLENYPKLKTLIDRVASQPAIVQWVERYPVSLY